MPSTAKVPLDPKALGMADPFDFSETNVPDDTYLHNALKAQYDIYIASSITSNLTTTNADPNTAANTATPSPLTTHPLPHLLTNIHTTNPLLQMQHALTHHPTVKLPSPHPVHAVYVDEVEKSERVLGECFSLINGSIDGESERREKEEREKEKEEMEAEEGMWRGWGSGLKKGFEEMGGDEDGSGSGSAEKTNVDGDGVGGDENGRQRESAEALGKIAVDGEVVHQKLVDHEGNKEEKGKEDAAFLETNMKALFASRFGEEAAPGEDEVAQDHDTDEKKEDEEVAVARARLKNLFATDVGEESPRGEKKEAQDDKADGKDGEEETE